MARFSTVPELAREVGLSRAAVYRLVDRGLIRAIRIGGAIRIPADEVERVMREGTDQEAAR